ncbi:MAG TPA: FAD-dependent thymidylate synthase [Kofleriaceae bacterium]|jgi:thymidylate synthase (FAD)
MTEETRLVRTSVEALDAILGVKFPVLDDGFIRAVDYLGSDASIVQAARVSYGVGTKTVHEDSALIRYLMRHRHTTPFEMCELKVHVRVPMDTWRQWIRHRTASVNEYSTRYSIAIDAAAKTLPSEWRIQAAGRKQGSDGNVGADTGDILSQREGEFLRSAREVYEERLAYGVAREQARKDLPLSTYTEAYWKVDLHNLLGFLSLRMDSHAQQEIRTYADVLGNEIMQRWCPVTWQAFTDYRMNAIVLTSAEVEISRLVNRGELGKALERATERGWVKEEDGVLRANRERDEAEAKFAALGIVIPWRQKAQE